ncbi:MAG: adenine-specific methyltransferase EcoRI family protein [Prevotellaceae bacterium]|nr:adenine-specific methyltransferase EcoRI family protein [Prevotellaceae bacterium]
MANKNLSRARAVKNDEFYTQFYDIEREIQAYLDYNPDVFRGKTVLLPCDDPEWSNFTRYFAQNFELLGLKKLISTSYAYESKTFKEGFQLTLFEEEAPQFDPNKTRTHGKIFTLTNEKSGSKRIDLDDLKWDYLDGDGDFRSKEVCRLRDEADIIVTNPPFSLFREFFAWIMEAEKDFIIIGNINVVTFKEVFPYIKQNKAWLGVSLNATKCSFIVPNAYEGDNVYYDNGIRYAKVNNAVWFTNLEHGKRHQPLTLMTMEDNLRYSKHKEIKGKAAYDRYDNYDAIEVPYADAIPNDYDGVMGVPVTFLNKYCPEQFEIIDINPHFYAIVEQGKEKPRQLTLKNANKKDPYARILIRKKQ